MSETSFPRPYGEPDTIRVTGAVSSRGSGGWATNTITSSAVASVSQVSSGNFGLIMQLASGYKFMGIGPAPVRYYYPGSSGRLSYDAGVVVPPGYTHTSGSTYDPTYTYSPATIELSNNDTTITIRDPENTIYYHGTLDLGPSFMVMKV